MTGIEFVAAKIAAALRWVPVRERETIIAYLMPMELRKAVREMLD